MAELEVGHGDCTFMAHEVASQMLGIFDLLQVPADVHASPTIGEHHHTTVLRPRGTGGASGRCQGVRRGIDVQVPMGTDELEVSIYDGGEVRSFLRCLKF